MNSVFRDAIDTFIVSCPISCVVLACIIWTLSSKFEFPNDSFMKLLIWMFVYQCSLLKVLCSIVSPRTYSGALPRGQTRERRVDARRADRLPLQAPREGRLLHHCARPRSFGRARPEADPVGCAGTHGLCESLNAAVCLTMFLCVHMKCHDLLWLACFSWRPSMYGASILYGDAKQLLLNSHDFSMLWVETHDFYVEVKLVGRMIRRATL